MICKKCSKESGDEFYKNDKTCKECRRALVRAYRNDNIERCREYDRQRFQNDPKVKLRHKMYQQTDAGKKAATKAKRKWLRENIVKRAAHTLVGNAVRDNKLFKPTDCEVCGDTPNRLHGHHNDYTKPLEVRWLCSKCHTHWHVDNEPID